MTYYKALKQLYHRARFEAGEDPIIPAGDYCEITHCTPDEIELLISMDAIQRVTDDEYQRWEKARAHVETLKQSAPQTRWQVEDFIDDPEVQGEAAEKGARWKAVEGFVGGESLEASELNTPIEKQSRRKRK